MAFDREPYITKCGGKTMPLVNAAATGAINTAERAFSARSARTDLAGAGY
jgi:hypothetical protein